MKYLFFLLSGLLIIITACASPGEAVTSSSQTLNDEDLPLMTVYKSPTCGCCSVWGEHMERNGFTLAVEEVENTTSVKREYRIPSHLQSCHTAIIDGYVIEGHVPAEDVKRLLIERPENIIGLTVPGMPIGSPGMEVEGADPQAYDVLTFNARGETKVFASYN
jgi:hypothetical protein